MIEKEPVRRPPPPHGDEGRTWQLCHSRRLIDLMGQQGDEKLIQSLAVTLHDWFLSREFIVWAMMEQERFCTYFCFADPGLPPHLLHQIAAEHAARVTGVDCAVPPEAVPVLKHRENGCLVRLWPVGTVGLQPSTQITADWSVLTLENRYYSLDE